MDSHFPHNLVTETILWEMSVLFDYCSLLFLCVSWPVLPASPYYAEHIRLKDKENESEYLYDKCNFMFCYDADLYSVYVNAYL